jgi:hypothetical protein
MLLAFTVTTPQAYNGWPETRPGNSLYLSDSPTRLRHVSFNRPDNHQHYVPQQIAFLTWLERNGYVVDYCTSLDLHTEAIADQHTFIAEHQTIAFLEANGKGNTL